MTHSPFSIRIGTRSSALALKQAEIVQQKLMLAYPACEIKLVPMVTSGDRHKDRPLADIGGKGLFTKELQEALLQNRIDIAVHSLKDMESHLPDALIIAAVLEREDPRDAFISYGQKTLAALPSKAQIGTSSPRRSAQIRRVRPDLVIVPLRGNVTTRIAKLKQGSVAATLLALAGLKRLKLEEEATEILDVEKFIPAAGQGTIAIECRKEDDTMREVLSSLSHLSTYHATLAERGVLAAINGSCRTPIGAYAQIINDRFSLRAMIASPDGSEYLEVTRVGTLSDAEKSGIDAGTELLARGGSKWVL